MELFIFGNKIKPALLICVSVALIILSIGVAGVDGRTSINNDPVETQSASSELGRVRRKSKDCGSKIELLNCDLSKPMNLNPAEINKIKASYTKGTACNIKDSNFHYTILLDNGTDLEFNNYYNKDTLVLKPYTIGAGSHHIIVYVREYGDQGETSHVSSDICQFNVKIEIPVPKISGGSEITVNSGQSYRVDGSESIDVSVPKGAQPKLQFKWSCSVEGVETLDFCQKNLGSADSVVISSNYANVGSIYTFTLSVRTSIASWQSTQQKIHFKKDAALIKIRCLKNCVPAVLKTDSKEAVILEAICVRNCGKVKPEIHEWTIDDQSFDYSGNTRDGRNMNIFYIKEGVLEVGRKYVISVNLKELTGGSSVKIEVHRPPKLHSCTVNPNSGDALTTKFIVSCDYDNEDYMFELYSVKTDLEVLLDRGVKLKDMPLLLSPGVKLKVKMIDDFRFSDSKMVDVTVRSTISASPDKLDSAIENKYFDKNSSNSLNSLLSANNYDSLIQAANSMVDELKVVPKTEESKVTMKKYQVEAFQFLEKVPIKDTNRARQIRGLATKIVNDHMDEPDPEIAALGTSICKSAGQIDEDRLKTEKFPQSFSEEIKEGTKVLSKCSQASATPNLEIMKTTNTTDPPTPFPLLDVPVIMEDYPDYIDDQNVSKFRHNFEIASNNMIELCFINTKTLKMTMALREDAKSIKSDSIEVTAWNDIGKVTLNSKIESQGVTLIPSTDFEHSMSKVSISLCTFTKNPFWWIQKEDIHTSVATIKFTVKGNRIHRFDKPFSIAFKISSSSSSIETHEGSTPRKPNGTLSQKERDFEKISLHRIDVTRGQGFTIEFSDFSDVLDVTITDLYKPTYQEFLQIARKITKENNTIRVSHSFDYDSWYYLGVLPSSKTSNEVKYKFRVYTFSCYSWKADSRSWQVACKSSENSNMKQIECKCYHASTLVGRIVNNKVKQEETLIEELELEIQASVIIFISVAVVFFLYCVLLTCFSVVFKSKSELMEKKVFFLCDVPNYYRYGYLIIIQTANRINAGTTSNIVVKLYGAKSESKEHVLNYPDPEQKLLQRDQEDWLFMATEHYLGDIEKIDIWFDSIGYRPNWYCSKIEIFDVQGNKYWLFEVNKRFEILNNEDMIYTAYPEDPKKKTSKKNVFFKKVIQSLHGPHMWNIITYEDQSFPRIKRLTLILSIFMTTYTMGLFLYGCPSLQDKDSLAYTTKYGLHLHVVLITIGCFIFTFALHFPLVRFFRHSGKTVLDYSKIEIRLLLQDVNFRCWCTLVLNITLCMTLLVIFGFWVPHITGLLWLTSVIISLLIYIFLMENIAKLIYNWSKNEETRINYIFNRTKSIITHTEQQRSMLYKKFGWALLRPFLSHLYKPMDGDQIRERRHWAETKEKVLDIVEDLIMITIYVVLLYLVILKDKDPDACLSHREVEELVEGTHSRTIKLGDIQIRKEVEDYIQETLIFFMQSSQWYGKFVTKNPGMTIENVNKYIGISRLRQHRVHNDTSKVIKLMSFVTKVHHPSYWTSPDKRNFSEGWKDNKYSDSFARMDMVWKYLHSNSSGTFGFVGGFGYYPGGGYIATLGRTQKNSIINAKYLFRNNWIDELTRSMFIEFLLYSSNSNLFNSVTILFEFSSTGYIRTKQYVETVKLLFVKEETNMMLVVIFISFLVMIVILTIKMVYRILRKRKLVFKDAWHVVDIFIILMSVTCVFLYVERSELVRHFLSKVESSRHNEFINYFHLLYAENILSILAAILVFIATLRLWKLLRFMVIIKIVEKTLLLSAKSLLCLLLSQLLIILCFACTGILLFCDKSHHFTSVFHSFSALLFLSLNFLSDFELDIINGPMAHFYYSAFMIIMLIYATIYVTVITICYAEAQVYYSGQQGYNVKDYVREQYMYYSELGKVRWKNVRLRAGDEDSNQTGYVYPKADEHRYADCLTVPSNKMRGMSLVSKCILRNMRSGQTSKMTDQDADLIKMTIVNLYREDSDKTNKFYMGNDDNGKVKFVDDATLVKMERIVAILLRKDEIKVDSKQKEMYQVILDRSKEKLNDMELNLKTLLETINEIDIDVDDL